MTVAMIGVVATVILLGVAVASLGLLYSARAQATTAADAAALAAAVATYPPAGSNDPGEAAAAVARTNGAALLGCICPTDPGLDARTVQVETGIEVTVPIFGDVMVRSRARAEFDPMRWLGR